MVKTFKTVVAAFVAIVLLPATLVMLQLVSDVPDVSPSRDVSDNLGIMAQISARRFQLIDELLAGRLSLKQTAAAFRALSEECPYDPVPYLRKLYPDYSDEDLHYLHVIRYAETVYYHGRSTEEAIECLRQEFQTVRRTGDIHLNDRAAP
jgi:hypothetical protein